MTPAHTAPPRTLAANQARQRTTQDKLRRVEDALKRMRRQGVPVTYPAVARQARVSRTFLYQHDAAKTLMTSAITTTADLRQQARAVQDAQAEASWRQRALNAEDALQAAFAEIRAQREQIGKLLGQIRDLEAQYTHDAAQRVAADNSALKQRARQLAQDNRGLQDKLQAARSNNRFPGKRIAGLEAELPGQPAGPS
jgi:hypothetical protein